MSTVIPLCVLSPHLIQVPIFLAIPLPHNVATTHSLLLLLLETNAPLVRQHHIYADDTQLLIPFKPHDEAHARQRMAEIFLLISNFMKDNHLKLNANKTIFLPISCKPRQFQPLTLNEKTVIPPSTEARNLGVIMTSDMSLDKQVSYIRKSCYYHLKNLAHLKKLIPSTMLHTLTHAYVTSRFDFCNSLLGGSANKLLAKLQSIQNSSARILTNTRKFDHISPTLRKLHWLPVKYRVMFKLAVIAHKSIYNERYPAYIKTNLVLKKSVRTTRSSLYPELYNNIKPRLSSVGGRSIYQQSISTWNNLPGDIRVISKLSTFRARLKTHLFMLAYS